MAADLYGDIMPDPAVGLREYLPGLLVVTLSAMAAMFLAERYGAPATLMALLIGLSLNFLSHDPKLEPGLAFAAQSLLRWGIVLIGARVTVSELAALGPISLLSILSIATITIGVGIMTARKFGFSPAFGVLAGGAVAICGASAAMAISATLGERRINQAQLSVVLIGISAASAAAMIAYPLIAHAFALSNRQAGFLLGASIHDVAQALGAGYAYSADAGDTASIVKLSRVALLVPLLAALAAVLPKGSTSRRAEMLPWFIVGFSVLAGANSLGLIPPLVSRAANSAANAVLTAAVTATAIRSPLAKLREAGLRPLMVIICATLAAFMAALGAALWLIA